jgi:hypothetical protein
MNVFKRFILWDYPRAGWQYDVMVALILAFIFLTPREIFRDQPRASSVVLIPSNDGNAFFIEPDLLDGVPEAERVARANTMIRTRTGKRHTITRLEPIFNSEKDVTGYMAFPTR